MKNLLKQYESTFLKMTKKKKIICIGSLGWDYIAVTDYKLKFGDDVPGQVTKKPGGVAGNVAKAIAKLSNFENDPEIFLISAIGNNTSSVELRTAIKSYNINCDYLITNNGNSDQYVALEKCGELVHAISDNSQLMRAEKKIIDTLLNEDVFKTSTDYDGILILDTNLTNSSFEKLSEEKSLRMFDLIIVSASSKKARNLSKVFEKRPVTLYSNLDEAQIISNKKFNSTEEAAKYLVEMGASAAIITDGGNKVSSFCSLGLASIKPKKSKNITATGAGDFFLAAHLLSKVKNPNYSPEKHLLNAEVTTREKLTLKQSRKK